MSDRAAAPTERLYYTDAYLEKFSAAIVERADDGKRIYLDRTAFYPTSGGQLHDLGTLGGSAIVDVIDDGERIAHVLREPLDAARVNVEALIDWPRRFDHMQQHTGQHLLSAVFEDLFGMKTVSVHFGDDRSTLDLETNSLSAQQVLRAERRANEIVASNAAVSVAFEDSATAKGLRKTVDREGTLRIVTIDGLDRSACGGTHVRATGEIGGILLRGTETVRNTIRVEFVCGLRAIARARKDFSTVSTLAAAMSAKGDDLAELIPAQAERLKDATQTVRRMERTIAGYHAHSAYEAAAPNSAGVRVVIEQPSGESTEFVRAVGQAMLDRSRVVYVAPIKTGNGLLIAATEDSEHDAGKLIREALTVVGGKGGGSPRLAQGSAPSIEALSTAVATIRGATAIDR